MMICECQLQTTGGSQFLHRIFSRYASVCRRGPYDTECFMTKADLLRVMRFSALGSTSSSPSSSSSSSSSSFSSPSSSSNDVEQDRLAALLFQLMTRNTGTSLINFSEFVHFDLLMSRNHPNADLEIVFRLIDANRDGAVSREELSKIMRVWADSQTEAGYVITVAFMCIFLCVLGLVRADVMLCLIDVSQW